MPILETPQGWVLETRHTAYALGVDAGGLLRPLHFGSRWPQADYPQPVHRPAWSSFYGVAESNPQEYPAYAGATYREPCFKASFADGVRDTVLVLEGHTLEGGVLQLHLRDTHYPLHLTLHYRPLEDLDLLERWVSVHNRGQDRITLERVFSADLHLPEARSYALSHLHGRWLDEFHLTREPLTHGVKVLESRRLTSGHQNYPWFAVDEDAREESGEVWFGALAWSGNWKLTAEHTEFAGSAVSLGLNDWDFAWALEAGDQFDAPRAVLGYTQGGFGGASRALHRYVRSRLPHGDFEHPVLYNSWEATQFEVTLEGQSELAGIAADLGVELFVVDDGWFAGRVSDHAGLGDWWADPLKFPQGLPPLISRVHDLGMKFGLWLEPEMVNPDSGLYRAHPDWAIHFPTRERTELRQQLILNLARPEVQDHLIHTLSGLLEGHAIDFIKWDMNRNVSEPGWAGHREPRELWVRYVQGLYRVVDTLRARFPHIVFQSCSGGGGRADLGMLERMDQVWPSDNTLPDTRLSIQHGLSQVLPACTCESWVTDMGAPHYPLEFRFHAAMCGVLGIGANLLHWSPLEREQAGCLVAQYRRLRPILQGGELFRLRPPSHPFSALMFLSTDGARGVLLAFRTHLPDPAILPPVRLCGLERSALYQLEGFPEPISGARLLELGLTLELSNLSSVLIEFERVGG